MFKVCYDLILMEIMNEEYFEITGSSGISYCTLNFKMSFDRLLKGLRGAKK